MEGTRLYEFGPYRQDPVTRTLTREGALVEIAPKTFDTLLYLVANAGRTVPREEIIKAVWPDIFVEEGNLNYNISQARKILGEYSPGVPYIQTVPKQGYRFVARVGQVAASSAEPPVDKVPPSRLRWMRWAAVPVLAAAAIAPAMLIRGRMTSPEPGLIRLSSGSGLTMTPALSRDGKLVAYASDRGGEGNLHLWVQQVGAGEPVRLTSGPADDYSPCFSPDGLTIVFRSERDGGGIYVVPVAGGETKKLAPFGRRPKYSPDGKWIAYWIGTDAIGFNQTNFPIPGSGRAYVVPSEGGSPEQIRPDFAAVAYPIWADDTHILFLGNRDARVLFEPSDLHGPGGASVDWWVTPIQTGSATPTGANAAFRALGLASISQVPEEWTQSGVLISAATGDTQNLWRIPISLNNWKVSGAPQRLTSGTTMDGQASEASGRVAFASLNGSLDVWSIPIDADRAVVSGSVQRITSDAFDHSYPAVSPDGRMVAYSSRRSGTRELWARDLATGKESVISAPPGSVFGSVFSPDGTRVAYRSVERQRSMLQLASLAGAGRKRVAPCDSNGGWSSDGNRLLCVGTVPARVSVIDLQSGQITGLLDHASWALWNPHFSPDDRWISFNATVPGRSHIFVAPVRGPGLIPESEWIPVTDGVWDDKARWSPDGNTLYFISERDGYRCIWAQRLDPSKHPAGEAFPIFHAHEARRSLVNVQVGALELSVARDKIVFNMSERSGNVWMMNIGHQK